MLFAPLALALLPGLGPRRSAAELRPAGVSALSRRGVLLGFPAALSLAIGGGVPAASAKGVPTDEASP